VLARTEKVAELAEVSSEKITEVALKWEETLFARFSPELHDVVYDHVDPAKEAAELIPLTERADERVAQGKTADTQLAEAIKDIEQFLKQMPEHVEDLQEAAELDDVAQREQDLADEVGEQPGDDPPSEEWLEEQRQVADDIGELVSEDPEALAQQLEEQQQHASALAGEADKLAATESKIQDLIRQYEQGDSDPQKIQKGLLRILAEEEKDIQSKTEQLGEIVEPQTAGRKTLDAAYRQLGDTIKALDQEDVVSASDTARQAEKSLQQAAASQLIQQQEQQTGREPGQTPEKQPGKQPGQQGETTRKTTRTAAWTTSRETAWTTTRTTARATSRETARQTTGTATGSATGTAGRETARQTTRTTSRETARETTRTAAWTTGGETARTAAKSVTRSNTTAGQEISRTAERDRRYARATQKGRFAKRTCATPRANR
jgi:hypothetical protein